MTHPIRSILTRLGAVLLFASLLGVAVASADSAKFQSLKRSDFISQDDVRHAPNGYALHVSGAGDFVVTGLVAPVPGKKCMVDKDSLRDILRANPPEAGKTEWLSLNYIPIDESLGLGSYVCIGLGTGCYIIVSRGGNDASPDAGAGLRTAPARQPAAHAVPATRRVLSAGAVRSAR